jgi:regulatory protein
VTTDHDGEDLAPVTDLFGARSRRRSSAAGDRARQPSGAHDEDDRAAEHQSDAHDHAAGPSAGADTASADQADADTPVPVPIRGAQSEWLSPVVGDGSGRTARSEQSGYDGDEADAPTASVFSITGGEIDPADVPRPLDEQRADAERISMRALSRRGVSTSELRTMLTKQDEFDPDVIEQEIERLTRVGLLDDVALATDLVDRMHSRKGLGRQAIVADLRRRGIDQTAIDAALDAAADDEDDEFVRAIELAAKRAGQMRGLDRATAERRLSGFLMRKGYNGGVVRVAVERALDGPRRPPTGPGTVRFE